MKFFVFDAGILCLILAFMRLNFGQIISATYSKVSDILRFLTRIGGMKGVGEKQLRMTKWYLKVFNINPSS